ncbi:MAG: hypothetical protein ONB23_11010 [candidate division KSB1 bacterium]|nr:hypothetical protein [candidate division KSB1 bacterium]
MFRRGQGQGILLFTILALTACAPTRQEVLIDEDFAEFPSGPLLPPLGAHLEYHYFREAAPVHGWEVSTFTPETASQRAWRVIGKEGGGKVLVQTHTNHRTYTHPILVSGDTLWQNYILRVTFSPLSDTGLCGVVFRYQNDRCYYFFGVDGSIAHLKVVRHEVGFHRPAERILASGTIDWKPGDRLEAEVKLQGSRIRARFNRKLTLEAEDTTYTHGRVGLLADVPARYERVKVTMNYVARRAYLRRRAELLRQEQRLRAVNPRPIVWRKLQIDGLGVGRNLRFGDLDGDGQTDLLIGQVVHHGPKDRYSELSCLTAMTFDGRILWQIGEPDPWKDHLTNDVAFQIHDLDADGQNEVVYCMNSEIVVADGRTGRPKLRAPTPLSPDPGARFPRILGDCLFFCDLRGTGHPRDILIKDRYWNVWALNDRLEVLWHHACNTGHYPYAADIDNDGRDEVAIGYSLLDHDGSVMWILDPILHDHADGVAIVRLREDLSPVVLNAASDEGMLFLSLDGQILRHHRLGHVQNPAVANFRPDLPGLETVSINFWGNQGIVHLYDANGNVYCEFEPVQHGSMCLPVNWKGDGEEYFLLSASTEHGGMFDGWGRRVVVFPDDGHPEMCNAVLDITGDCRDEIVVWDPYDLWVYTQDDNPRSGRLYRPVRNPLYNYSNYQATVSLPGWYEGP